MMHPAVFLDRDGTVSVEIGYVNHVDRFELLARSAQAIRRLNESEFLAVLATNQAGVARGYFKEPLIAEVHEKLQAMLAEGGARLDGIYFCPHHPSVGEAPYRLDCQCRKPRPGMVEKAAKELGIDVGRSYMVGDKHSDILFAHRMGMPGILVKTGYGAGEIQEWSGTWTDSPDFIAGDLLDAVEWIFEHHNKTIKGKTP